MGSKLSVYVLGDYRPGLADGLAEFNFQNTVLLKDLVIFHFIEFDCTKEQDHYSVNTVDQVKIHCFGSKSIPTLKLPRYFKQWLSKLPLNNLVFHLNHIYNFNNYLVSRLLVKYRLPYLITPHDSYVYCKEFKSNKPLIKRIYRDLFVHFIDKYILDHANLVHALTSQCSPCLRLLTSRPIMIVSNQVSDLKLELNIKSIENRICFMGRSDIYQKGIDRAFQGFKLFKDSGNVLNDINLTIVGPSNPASDQLRHQLCKELGLEPGKDVIFAGRVEETEKNKILASSKVYIHLSRFEGFGLSVIQALSAFKPVIISRQVPTSNKIADYHAGFVIDSPEDTAMAISAIFALSADEYLEMALNARRCYEEQFHPDVIRPQLLELFTKAALPFNNGNMNQNIAPIALYFFVIC